MTESRPMHATSTTVVRVSFSPRPIPHASQARCGRLAATARGALLGAAMLLVFGCDRTETPPSTHGAASAAPPTNRVDIPDSVRQNLGITFAKVEYRDVARTLRVPGRFELLPSARREYRSPLPGRVELLVMQYERVEPGTPLYRIDSAPWRDLTEQIAATQAKVQSMGPLREAHRLHEQALTEKVALWRTRLEQLEEIRAAGGGSAAQFTEARATLNATQAELADVMEKDAMLEAQQKQAEAELRSLRSRREQLLRSAACTTGPRPAEASPDVDAALTICAIASGVVESVGMTQGGLAEEGGLVLTTVQPEQIRFRARALQSDLGRLRDGLPARIAPPQGGSIPLDQSMTGSLRLSLTADPDERTVDLVVRPEALAPWARAGVSATLEVTLEGGEEELAIPLAAVVRDGVTPVIFRRDPKNPDKVIRMEADLGVSDGRWVTILSGVREGDEIVLGGNYQLMLATSGSAPKGGHFHADGTWHEGDH